jgi:hypothetical protein
MARIRKEIIMLYTYEAGQPGAPGIVFSCTGWIIQLSGSVIERLPEFHCLAPDLPEQGK